jgi:hypothetical protein
MTPAVPSSLPETLRDVRRKRAALSAVILAALAGCMYLDALPCPFAFVFHTPCPGCGSTRAVLALLQGRFRDVLRYNPFGPVVAVLLLVLGVRVISSMRAHGDLRALEKGRAGRIATRVFVVVAVLEVILWVARFFGAFGGPVPV